MLTSSLLPASGTLECMPRLGSRLFWKWLFQYSGMLQFLLAWSIALSLPSMIQVPPILSKYDAVQRGAFVVLHGCLWLVDVGSILFDFCFRRMLHLNHLKPISGCSRNSGKKDAWGPWGTVDSGLLDSSCSWCQPKALFVCRVDTALLLLPHRWHGSVASGNSY